MFNEKWFPTNISKVLTLIKIDAPSRNYLKNYFVNYFLSKCILNKYIPNINHIYSLTFNETVNSCYR